MGGQRRPIGGLIVPLRGGSMMGDPTWDFMNPASKGRLLGVLERQIDEMFNLAAEPERWHAPTACPGWELRDMIGHLVTETEGYLSAFDTARRGVAAAREPVGVTRMAKAADDAARAFRHVPHDELLERFRYDTDRLMHEFESLRTPTGRALSSRSAISARSPR
jgi:uncharacterized protein (TIGR03083 family)